MRDDVDKCDFTTALAYYFESQLYLLIDIDKIFIFIMLVGYWYQSRLYFIT